MLSDGHRFSVLTDGMAVDFRDGQYRAVWPGESLCGAHKTRTTSYHPASDGLVVRFNRTLVMMLALYCVISMCRIVLKIV